jgi:NAD/NADP transhydrogenase alpha subunit
MKKTSLDAISTTTTIAGSVIIVAALIAFARALTSKVAFSVGYTKNMSNITDPTTVNLLFASHT